jgi:hypothetical protein
MEGRPSSGLLLMDDNGQIPPYPPFGTSSHLIKAQARGVTAKNATAGLLNTARLIFFCEAHGHANPDPLIAQSDESGGNALGFLGRNRTNQLR